MNKPTPFGKTYKEYTEAITDYKFSQLSSVQKVELGLADDVEKLTQQAKDLIPDMTRDIDGIKVKEKNVVTEEKLLTKRKSVFDKADQKENDARKNLDKAIDSSRTAAREFKESEDTLKRNEDSIEFLNKRLDKTKGKASKTRASLEKKLNTLEKAAKDLGVKIPTGEAAKVLKKLISLL